MTQIKADPLGLPSGTKDFPPGAAVPAAHGRVFGWEKRLLSRLLASLGQPPIRATLWNGQEIDGGGRPTILKITFRDRKSLLATIFDPEMGFGDGYASGHIGIEGDLVGFLEMVNRSWPPSWQDSRTSWARHWRHRAGLRHRNTTAGSRNNIHHHYDIGNDFYKLWLDQRMVYTCAYFPTPSATLEQAQVAKMDHVCRKVQLQPGQSVVEAGCGWGALALHMAKHYGVRVRAFNISHQQIVHARERAEAQSLSDRVEFVEDDYRNITGRYDAFVSVGMLEHVGPDNYTALGGVIDRCLAPAGRGLIHSIGRHRPIPMSAWIESRIFPGANPPTIRQMMDIFEPYDLAVLDVENLRLHYARTLAHWLERYDRAQDKIANMFDDRFVRAWRLYLAGSAAAFTTGWMQLFQVVFARHADNTVPQSRAHQYPA